AVIVVHVIEHGIGLARTVAVPEHILEHVGDVLTKAVLQIKQLGPDAWRGGEFGDDTFQLVERLDVVRGDHESVRAGDDTDRWRRRLRLRLRAGPLRSLSRAPDGFILIGPTPQWLILV